MNRSAISGFAIVTATFLLVVLALLGAFMVTLSGVHQAAPAQAVTATRVYYGTKAGLDWGIQQAIAVGGVAGCAASTSLTLTGSGLNGVTAVVTCASTAHTGGTVYLIVSTATYGTFGDLYYARRRLEATVTNIP